MQPEIIIKLTKDQYDLLCAAIRDPRIRTQFQEELGLTDLYNETIDAVGIDRTW